MAENNILDNQKWNDQKGCNAAVPNLSFEKALMELEKITKMLESGNVALDDAVTLYERACSLQTLCQEKLQTAQMKVEQIMRHDSGEERQGQKTKETRDVGAVYATTIELEDE